MKGMAFLLSIIITPLISCSQILYKCTSPSGDTVTYLIGTCHILPTELYYHDPRLDSIIGQADVVFSELYVSTSDPSYSKNVKKLRLAAQMEGNRSLKDFLNKEELNFVFNFYNASYGITRKKFKSVSGIIPPFMHSRLASDNGSKVKMDQLLHQGAVKSGRKIILLDNVELLTNAYRTLGKLYNARWLYNEISNSDSSMKKDNSLSEAYLNQDTAAIRKIMEDAPERKNPEYDHIIKNRNLHWETVLEQHSGKINFLYSGIAHLITDEIGLLDYFQRRGYSIRAVEIVSKQNVQHN